MKCSRCDKPATCVVDRRKRGRTIERAVVCGGCVGRGDDVVIEPRDFEAVIQSDACWCESSARLGVVCHYCPLHGQMGGAS